MRVKLTARIAFHVALWCGLGTLCSLGVGAVGMLVEMLGGDGFEGNPLQGAFDAALALSVVTACGIGAFYFHDDPYRRDDAEKKQRSASGLPSGGKDGTLKADASSRRPLHKRMKLTALIGCHLMLWCGLGMLCSLGVYGAGALVAMLGGDDPDDNPLHGALYPAVALLAVVICGVMMYYIHDDPYRRDDAEKKRWVERGISPGDLS